MMPATGRATAGTHTLTAEAEIRVKEVPQNVVILNDLGKYGRVTLLELTDPDNEMIPGASVSVSDPVTDPDYDESRYDGSVMGKIPDMLRRTYDIDIRVPMDYGKDQVKIRFEMQKDLEYSSEYILGDVGMTDWGSYYHKEGEHVTNDEQPEMTTGYLTIDLSEGKGSEYAMWFDRKSGSRDWWHSYDRFDVSVRTGTCEIIGRISSWDDRDNAEFLAYPSDMTDAEIREDVMGDRNKAYATSTSTKEAVQADARYEQSFKVGGLDAGKYKLAVVKPGKYTVSVVPAEIDGTFDAGTIALRLYGDINNDGKIRAGDATQVCRYIAGNRQLTEEEFLAADISRDGKIRAGDATQICRYVAGNSSAFDSIN